MLEALEATVDRIRGILDTKNAARDRALTSSRELTRHCANSIRASHRGDHELALQLLASARLIVERLTTELAEHPDLYHAGYTQDALKELAEANITSALIRSQPLPVPEELKVPVAAYLNGMGEAMGEMRRYVLDLLRQGGQLARCDQMLEAMDEVYGVLVTLDYPDTLTGGLRRTTDMVRGVLERTRGDVTSAAGQDALQRCLHGLREQLALDAVGSSVTIAQLDDLDE